MRQETADRRPAIRRARPDVSHLRSQEVSGQDFQPARTEGDRARSVLRLALGGLDDDRLDGHVFHGRPFAAVRVAVFTFRILSTTSMPSITLPKTA